MGKNLKRQWHNERQAADFAEAAHRRSFHLREKPQSPACVEGSDAAMAADVEKALALPAAQSEIFRLAHADLVGKSIEEDLLQTENPELRMDARGASVKLISALIKAQKQGPSNQVQIQINTGDVDMGGPTSASRSQDRRPRSPAPRTPPDDPPDSP